jgi:hypothetical protein
MLEGYTYDEPWPQEISEFELTYRGGEQRDLEALRKILHGERRPALNSIENRCIWKDPGCCHCDTRMAWARLDANMGSQRRAYIHFC